LSVTKRVFVAISIGWAGAGFAAEFFPASGAQQVCTDTPLSITFNQAPHLGTFGVIRIFEADGTLLDSIDLADPNSSKRLVGGAVSDNGTPHLFNYFPVIVTGNTAAIYLHRQLDYAQTYYVTMDPGVITSADGFSGISDPQTWRISTRLFAPPPGTNQVTVATDGEAVFINNAMDV
jgi:hypothetical protein